MEIGIAVILALMAYTYVGYPLLLALLAPVFSALRMRAIGRALNEFDSCSLVICAHNEEKLIGQKLQNLANQKCLPEDCEIVVATDGVTDATVEIALESARRVFGTVLLSVGDAPWLSSPGRRHDVRIVVFNERRGKASLLNAVMPLCRGHIIVLADTRQEFSPHAIRTLLRAFDDPTVGAVSGELILRSSHSGSGAAEGVGIYWNLEKIMRRLESRIDSTCGCTGAIYAIRKELFQPIHPDTILDDVAIPMSIAMRGSRVVFDGGAIAYDHPSVDFSQEHARKVRTLAGVFQLCCLYPALLNPLKNRIWVQFISHKLLRLLGPWLMIALLMLSFIAAAEHFWALLFVAAQMVFYCLAAVGVYRGRIHSWRIFSVPASFVMLNYAAASALTRFLGGNLRGSWERTGGGEKTSVDCRT